MSKPNQIHTCGQTLKGIETFCPRCGGVVTDTTQKPARMSVACVGMLKTKHVVYQFLAFVGCVIFLLVGIRSCKSGPVPATPAPANPASLTPSSQAVQTEPLPRSFGWTKIVAPAGPKTADGKLSLSVMVMTGHKHVMKPDGTFGSELERPEWSGQYRLAYRPVSPKDSELLMIVPDGNLADAFPFKDTVNRVNTMNYIECCGKGRPVEFIVGYIRKDLPANEFPPEESEFLARLLSRK